MKLSINRCSRHNFWSVSIDADRTGLRITPSKCCGSWSTVKQWELPAYAWRQIEEEARKAAEYIEANSTVQVQK